MQSIKASQIGKGFKITSLKIIIILFILIITFNLKTIKRIMTLSLVLNDNRRIIRFELSIKSTTVDINCPFDLFFIICLSTMPKYMIFWLRFFHPIQYGFTSCMSILILIHNSKWSTMSDQNINLLLYHLPFLF